MNINIDNTIVKKSSARKIRKRGTNIKDKEKAIVFISEDRQYSNPLIKKSVKICQQQRLSYRIYQENPNQIDNQTSTHTRNVVEVANKLRKDKSIKKLIVSGNDCLKQAHLTAVAQNMNIEIINLAEQKKAKRNRR